MSEANQTPMDMSSQNANDVKPLAPSPLTSTPATKPLFPQRITRIELARQTPDSEIRGKTNLIKGGSAAVAESLTDDIMFGLEIPENVSTAETSKAVTSEVHSGVLGYSRLPLRLKTRINPKTKLRDPETIIYSYRHSSNLVVKLFSILQSGIVICGVKCNVFLAARSSAMPRVLVAKVYEGGKTAKESWGMLRAEIDDLPGTSKIINSNITHNFYPQISTRDRCFWTKPGQQKMNYASTLTRKTQFGNWCPISVFRLALPLKSLQARSTRYITITIIHYQSLKYVLQLEVDENGTIMDRSADTGFKLKVHISGANDAKVFELIDPKDKVRVLFPKNIYTQILSTGNNDRPVQTPGRLYNAPLYHDLRHPGGPQENSEFQWRFARPPLHQHRNSRRPETEDSSKSRGGHKYPNPRQRGSKHISTCSAHSYLLHLFQYKGAASYDLTFSMEDQISASEVSGLGFAAKARRASHRELSIRRKLGGEEPSKTVKRRLQRQGHRMYIATNRIINDTTPLLQLLKPRKTNHDVCQSSPTSSPTIPPHLIHFRFTASFSLYPNKIHANTHRHSHQRQLMTVEHLDEESSHKKGEAAQRLLAGPPPTHTPVEQTHQA